MRYGVYEKSQYHWTTIGPQSDHGVASLAQLAMSRLYNSWKIGVNT